LYLKLIYMYNKKPTIYIHEIENELELETYHEKISNLKKDFTDDFLKPIIESNKNKDDDEKIYFRVAKFKNGNKTKSYPLTKNATCYLLDKEGQTIEKII